MAVLKDLIVHGNSRFLNTSYFNQLKTDKIGAEEGIFNKIVATTGDIGSLTVDDLTAGKATVLSLLDVRGELHTNQWTNSNIATIDGSFYITPTIGVPSGTMTTTANSVVINGSNFPISSLYVNGVDSDNTATTVAWTSGSKVLVTGEILVNGVYMPLGTLIGTLSANATASQIQVGSITDNRYQTAESLAEIGTQSTALPCRNVKVSLYQTSRSSTLYPLGIFMTALGENGKTFLDIYGGGYATSTATAGGFAKPVLRIGNLAGLPTVGGSTPTGYGIYTSNGYFSGAIVAKQGKIGDGTAAWTIGNDSNNRAYICSGITNITTSGSTTGIYVGTNGISNYNSTTQYVNLTDGKITAQGADITGKITASSGSIGGWNIGTDTNKSLYYGNQKPGETTTNLVLSPTSATNSNAIGGSGTGLTWFISAGKVFGVTTAGALYSTSGKIGGFNIGTTYLRNGNITSATNTSVAGVYLGTDGLNISNGTAATTSYITKTAINIGNKLTWNGTTLTIDGSASIGGTTASTVVSNAANGAAAKEGLDNLEVGGTNLLRGTRTQDTSLGNWREGVTATSDTLFGCTVFKSSGAWNDIGFEFDKQLVDTGKVKAGDIITYSIWAKTDDTTSRDIYGVWVGKYDGSGNYYSGAKIKTLTNTWTQYSKTFKVTAAMIDGSSTRARLTRFECNTACTSGKYIYWAAPKVEYGNKATAWSPAPEDVQAEIDAKTSVHNLLSSNTAGVTYATILSWAKEGTAVNFSINTSSTPITGIKVGDFVRLAFPVSNMGTSGNRPLVYINGTVTSIPDSTHVTMTTHGLDTTIIDGGNILTNSIGANQIKANAITASKMAIGDYNNYVTFTENDPDTQVNTYGAPQIVDGWIYKSNATDSNLHLSPALNKWATAGEKYRVTGTVKTPEGGSATVIIYGRNSSGTAVTNYALTTKLTANTETAINGIITILSGMDASTVVLSNIAIAFCTTETWSSSTSVGYCKNMKVERMAGGSLIVDGAITADKIAAKSIAIGKLDESTQEQITNSVRASDSKSGSIVTWNNMLIDGLVADIEPIQDLHGYDEPWVGGAGKNLLPNDWVTRTVNGITFTANSDGSVTANGTATADAAISISLDTSKLYGNFYFNGAYGGSSSTYNIYFWDDTAGARPKKWNGTTAIDNGYTAFSEVKLVQGNTTRIMCRVINGQTVNNIKFYPMIVASTETDTSYAPYENICPISGYTEVDVVRTGKNLADFTDGYSVGTNGLPSAYSKRSATTTPILIKPNKTYKGICSGTNVFLIYSVLDANNTLVRRKTAVTSGTVLDTSGGTYLYVCGYDSADINTITAEANSLMVIDGNETDITYEPYQGNTYTIDLNGTRYGGTLDVATGVLTVTKAIVDLGTLTWGYDTSGTYHYFRTNDLMGIVKNVPSNDVPANILCSCYKTTDANTPYVGSETNCICEVTFGQIRVYDTAYSDAASFKTAMNGVQLCYELATPTTVQLTAQEVSALVGTNVLWANSGDVHVELVGVKDYTDGISDAAKTATNYITQIDSEGIWVTPYDLKPTDTLGTGATGTKIDGTGLDIYQNGISVAHYGDYARIGKDGEANTVISPDEVIISASENISALRITPDGNEQLVSYVQFINYTLEPGESSTYTFPSDATSGSYIKYRIVGRYYGDSCIFDITDVKVGTSTPIKHITSPFKFDYSADTTSITITNTESSDRIRVDRVTYYATSISPLIEAGGVLTLGNSPTVDAYTLLAVGNGTNSFSVDRAGNMRCRNYGINDFVVDQGASSTSAGTSGTVDWDYRKWYSGFAECWGTVNLLSATYAANGGYKAFTFDFPYGLFVSSPRCLEVSGGISGVVHTDIGFTAVNNADSGQAYLINRNSSAVTASGHAYVHAVGSWKTY